jgi:hypothetical protein
MPDGIFKYLLNYIDHGVKKLTSIPLAAKWATSVAVALLTIFTKQGPPSILQSDNGCELSNHAHDYVGHWMLLDDDFVDLVIKELKNLWPECQMVRCSPRNSESNGGVKRVNQTVQKKLGGWMTTNNSMHWSIGCKIAQWRINTQVHQTLKDTPFCLVYGMNSHVGISNLPILKNILNALVTEAGLNDMISHLDKDLAAVGDVGSESLVASPPIAHVDKDLAAVVDVITPIGHLNKRKQEETSKSSRDAKCARHTALAQVMVQEESSPRASPPREGITIGKTDDTPTYICWLELIDQRSCPVKLQEILHSRVNSIFLIIYCTNSKDISDESNWAPCILRKIQKEQYEVLDMHKRDKVDEDLDWGGNEGLLASWTMYHKYPTMTFVNLFYLQIETFETNDEAVKISPRCLSLRNQATANVQKKADTIKANIMKTSPQLVFKVGDVVLIPLDDVNRTKVDGANLAGVVVLINKDKSNCWLAVKQGLMHRAYPYHVLKPVPEASNYLDVMDCAIY